MSEQIIGVSFIIILILSLIFLLVAPLFLKNYKQDPGKRWCSIFLALIYTLGIGTQVSLPYTWRVYAALIGALGFILIALLPSDKKWANEISLVGCLFIIISGFLRTKIPFYKWGIDEYYFMALSVFYFGFCIYLTRWRFRALKGIVIKGVNHNAEIEQSNLLGAELTRNEFIMYSSVFMLIPGLCVLLSSWLYNQWREKYPKKAMQINVLGFVIVAIQVLIYSVYKNA